MLIILGILGFLMIVGSLLLLIFKKPENNSKKRLLISIVILGIIFFLISASLRDTSSHETSKVSEKDPILDVKTNEKSAVTADQLKKIKLGDSYEKVVKVLGYPKEVGEDFTWKYDGENSLSSDAYAIIEFDLENKVDYIEQSGITSKDTTGIDEDGINNFSNPEKSTGIYKSDGKDNDIKTTNEDYAYFVQFAIEDTIGEKVDWNGKKKNTVREVEVNDNMGKQDGSKLILIRLNAPISATNNAIKKKVNEATLRISKVILDDINLDFEKDSITFFWYLPLTDSYGNTKEDTAYKISLEKDTLSKINFDDIQNVDLPAIADQYNVLFNE
ncbi:hypothetical protein [Aeribacillus sp. FSL M8-0235]|uniref:hypothetical protein n=1 Tax=Aeribacillus sp. FSL M8-0235 TaxID=2954576 RepID=UPI0030FD0A05